MHRPLARIAKALTFVTLGITLAALVALGFAGYSTAQDIRAALEADAFGAPYLDYARA